MVLRRCVSLGLSQAICFWKLEDEDNGNTGRVTGRGTDFTLYEKGP